MKTIHTVSRLALTVVFLIGVAAWSQTSAPQVSLPSTEQRTLTSTKIGQRYDLLVSLPNGYATSGQSYPVLYILDGWHFPLMAFLQENNIFEADAPGHYGKPEPWFDSRCNGATGA